MQKSIANFPEELKLNLGCGPVQPRGWINIDGSNRAWLASRVSVVVILLTRLGLIPPTEFGRSTMYANLSQPIPFPDESISVVYAGELWEHFEYAGADALTRECFRVLKPNGILRVCGPAGVEISLSREAK